MQYVPLVPLEGPLAGRVETVFWLDGYTPEHRLERLVPDGRMNLVIELDGRTRHVHDNTTLAPVQPCRVAWLSGVHTDYLTIGDVGPATRLAAVRFAPGGAPPFVHEAADAFADRVVPAVDVIGASIAELRDALAPVDDGAEVTRRLAAWVASRYDPSFDAPPVVRDALDTVLADPASVRWTAFVEARGDVSYRHFVDLFRKQVGAAPKTFQRILRFTAVFERLQSGQDVNWAALALDLGYADQAHFVREFRAFSGYRPSDFRDAGHDRVNFFPDDDG